MTISRRERLEAELAETRNQVDILERQLQEVIELDQHESIDHLDEHFNAVDERFKGLKLFFRTLLEEKSSENRK
ncbi:hypothetical protein [Luteolibacter sp. AS25]|uniref:hypothetical protein n=1 Tax=Luteolibacter sp. AS25 TaxID=3135776 RepID=UPI00398B551C